MKSVPELNSEPLLSSRQEPAKSRFEGLDIFRGFIMILMAWDHSKDVFVSTISRGSEGWQGEGADFENSIPHFFGRIVSDICAPGFFFTMGLSMVFLTDSRVKKRGWGFWDIQKHFLTRAFVLFCVGRLIAPAFSSSMFLTWLKNGKASPPFRPDIVYDSFWDLASSSLLGTFQVMTSLSLTMALISICILVPHFRYGRKFEFFLYFLVFLCFAVSVATIVHFQYGNPREARTEFPAFPAFPHSFSQFLVRILLIPGGFIESVNGRIGYPLIPWCAFAFLGVAMASAMKKDYVKATSQYWKLGLGCLIGFFISRLFLGSLTNMRGWPRGDGSIAAGDVEEVSFIIEFFWTSKYPPSVSYALGTMSLVFNFIWLFSTEYFASINNKYFLQVKQVFITFGQVPLFFYLLHFYIICSFNTLYFIFTRDTLFVTHEAYNVFIWIPLLAVLFPACKAYGKFKAKTADNSVWRLL